MKIEILGCSGSVAIGYNTTSILINGDTLIDAGSAASILSDTALRDVRHILLTHSHIDHIKELPFILDVMYGSHVQGVTIWGSKQTMDVLKAHVFNGLIWPEMEELKVDESVFRFACVPKDEFEIGQLKVKAVEVDHIPGSVAYVIAEEDRIVIFSGDTGYTQDLFDLASSYGDKLKAFFIEASFPNRMHEIAKLTHHLTPGMIGGGIQNFLNNSPRVIAYHIKPKYLQEVLAELPERVNAIKGGEVFIL
jgi:ribonuclease BN (tRNA processing enzyme)